MPPIQARVSALLAQAETRIQSACASLEQTEQTNLQRILKAFRAQRLAAHHFAPSTGYGYGDIGRDTLEAVFAEVFGCESALVRPSITSGTHALSLCLFGVLRPGDTLLAGSGRPYDTLETVIGLTGERGQGSLAEYNVAYQQVELNNDALDIPALVQAAQNPKVKLVALQRSRGYAWRRALSLNEIGEACQALHAVRPNLAVLVDNCYGEFVETREPTHLGADLIAGSLIKNPGGGLAPTGGYIAGKQSLVEACAYRLTSPGIGREVGSYAASYAPFYQGLFFAPHTVVQALKGAMLAAAVFEELGYAVSPRPLEPRGDIIQAIRFGEREALVRFVQAIQYASPVESHVVPEPWDMPGYQDPVIMAAGTFVAGASIELSADAPIRAPYIGYLQGGLTYAHVKLALGEVLQRLL